MFIQLLILLLINFLGILIQKIFNLPLPGTIIGMIILFILLYKKILNEENIGNICDNLIKVMVLLFLPAVVNLMEHYHYLKADIIKIIILLVITTAITMGITGKTVEFLIKKMGGK
ncbi:CidA/LrgA family protein [Fusobacterium perfoetens]|uniref:CidA/LrgA family protein n=1 Tax=Fusobacterium perfoetens TaxID=852 RepID=UPI000487C834|nr:CidA/LrgA family protein [Fusobacterium perfoetens]MCI6151824.1 CidA/LrgA family protein [Fusobacterium perfoetens]MDY3236815.1 CidA/LrgA family protein [Fusobacterium perfoetens]